MISIFILNALREPVWKWSLLYRYKIILAGTTYLEDVLYGQKYKTGHDVFSKRKVNKSSIGYRTI